MVQGHPSFVRGHLAIVRRPEPFVRGHQPVVPAIGPVSAAKRHLSTDVRVVSMDIGPLSTDKRVLFLAPLSPNLHPNQEVTMSKRYPRTEAEMAALALRVAEGLTAHPEDFPNPPVPAAELKAKWEAFNAADTATAGAKDAFMEQHAVKDDAFPSTAAQHLLSNQPRGVELFYRVVAVNKAGAGQPSATVTVVL